MKIGVFCTCQYILVRRERMLAGREEATEPAGIGRPIGRMREWSGGRRRETWASLV